MTDIVEEFESCNNALVQAKKFGLEVEVVVFALKAMKRNPNLSIEEALGEGLAEWDI